MGLSGLDPCHLCAVCLCNICACSSCLPCLFVCLFVCLLLSGRHVCLSVTKRHKAHLKRLDRRWTLGGVISRQQSRGELRQMLHHLPPSPSYCSPHPASLIVSYHMAQLVPLHMHIFVESFILCCLPANAFIMSHNPPQLTTNWL